MRSREKSHQQQTMERYCTCETTLHVRCVQVVVTSQH